MYGDCSSTCPGNCSGLALSSCKNDRAGGGSGECENDGRKAGWYYIQKSLNPAKDDETYKDITLKTICKRKLQFVNYSSTFFSLLASVISVCHYRIDYCSR